MSSSPSPHRHTPLNERLRLLDDTFVPTPTPTNTWLNNVHQSDEDEVVDYDDDTPTEDCYEPDIRTNRFEKPIKPTRGTSQAGRKQALSRILSDPRSSSLPPAIQSAQASPSPWNSADREPSRSTLAHSQAQRLRDDAKAHRRTASDP